jgi:hypothetical protein
VRGLDDARAVLDEGVEAQVAELVPTRGDEEHCAPWSALDDVTDGFKPTDQPATTLRRALPPAAARCDDDHRRHFLTAAGNGGYHVRRLCWRSDGVRHEMRRGALRGAGVEPLQLV